MDSRYDKPFMYIYDQIALLANERKLNIEDYDFAYDAIMTMSYYDLINGYKECFCENDIYLNNMSIEFLYMFKALDVDFKNILFKYSVYVENRFKNILAYAVSCHYGVDHNKYLATSVLRDSKKKARDERKRCLNHMKFLFDTEKGSYLDEPTKHYILKKGNVPAWILFKNARFSETINYYGLSKPFIKNEVVHLLLPSSYISLNTQKELLKKSLHLVRKFRNVIAHNLKFITYRTDDEYNFNKIPSECIKGFFPDEFLLWKEVREKTRGIDDPYAMFNSLFVLLGDSYLQGKFMDEIESLIQTISSKQPTDVHAALVKTYLETINFPPDIIDRFNAYRARETKEYSQ